MAQLTLGLVFDLLGTHPAVDGAGLAAPPDADVEYEPEATVAVLEAAIRRLGHVPLRLGGPHDLLRAGGQGGLPRLDAALVIAEGYGSRNREAWAPVLLEMLEVPALGSDALTLSLSLDKAWTKDVVTAAGVPAPPHAVLASSDAAATATLPGPYPLFVKPRWEGTAKGIHAGSRVADAAALAREVERITRVYHQPALVEPFLDGAEYTVTVVDHDPSRALPALQRALERETGIGLHALEGPGAAAADGLAHYTPGGLDAALEKTLAERALRAFAALECCDFARVDFRVAAAAPEEPLFLEINPLPTFAPDGSFGILAELEGRSAEALLADVLGAGLRRLGLS